MATYFRAGVVAIQSGKCPTTWLWVVLSPLTAGRPTAGNCGEEQQDPGIRFTTEPSDLVLAPGDSALLPCAAMTKHGMRLAWRHSTTSHPTRDHGLSPTDKYRKQLPNGSLVIESMSAPLAGQYQCVVSVDGVGTIVSRVATVFLAEVPDLAPGSRSVLTVAGGVALLPCGIQVPPRLALKVVPTTPAPDRRVYGAARVHNAPPLLKLNVTWLKSGAPLRVEGEGARAALTASGALELDPVRHHDAHLYRCRVALAHRPDIYKTSEEIELRVSNEAPTVETPPRFIATPQPHTVMEGASVTFDCAAVGNPKPEITWLNNGVAIDLSDLDSRFYLVGSGSLRVQSARALDAGTYTCRAHSRLDSADHSTQLHVQTSPRVYVAGGAVALARTRGDVTLRCEVRGRPAPSVAWLKDGDPLTPNNHDIALVNGSSLRIQGVLRVDAGMFQCAASSPAGFSANSMRLVVLPPDDDIISHNAPRKKSKPQTNSTSSSTLTNHSPNSSNPTHDIFNTLVSTGLGDSTLDPGPEGSDFLGETSSAYTSGPQVDYENYDTSVYDESVFHAAEGLDLEELKKGNASVVSMPRALRAVIVKHRFVTLSWEEPEHKLEDVTGYAVIYRVKGSERERVSRGPAQKHEMNVASLQPNTTYQFAVLAYTEHSVSPPTETIEVSTPEEELTHGPPLELRVEPLGPHSARVSWKPPLPTVPGAPPPTKYAVHYTEVESGREQYQLVEAESSDPTAVVSCSLSALRAAAVYWVRVMGGGGAPAQAHFRTPSDAPAAPPANLTATSTSATSILVRWDAPPPRSHRGALTGFKVRYRAVGANPTAAGAPAPAAGRRKADSLTTPADARRAELRGLDTATTYQIRVCAINAVGSGPFSEWVSATTHHQQRDESRVPAQPPPLTTIKTIDDNRIRACTIDSMLPAARAGRDWISVWWGAGEEGAGEPAVVVRSYVLGWGLGVPDDMSRELPAHLHSHVIRSLESNSEYVISLRASNSLGFGPAVYATVRTKAAAEEDPLNAEDDADEPDDEDLDDDEDPLPPLIPPVGLKVIMLSGTTAVVYWTDPTLPKGQTATDGRRYVVRYAGGGGRARTFNATDLNCMLDDLRPFTQYEFAVKLIKGGRESAWSMLVSNTTLEAPPGSPPRELRVSPAAPPARAADLTWTPPTKPNGVITGYVIMYAIQRVGASAGSEEWTAVAVVGERGRARVDRLRPRTTYLFKLQARNGKGLGPFSAPVAYTTAMETGEGGGLASATSAWLWASAGGACAVLALAAALALSLCCRRTQPPLSPDTSTYQKSSASAGIKPPDLWIHHDQMELKHMDKGLHTSASKISAGSVEGSSALVSSTLTLGRNPPAEYEPARHHPQPPASLDRRHYVPTYVDRRSPSCAGSGSGSDDTAILRASPASLPSCKRCDCCDFKCKPMTGMGVGVGVGGVGCANTCDRRTHPRMGHPDQSTPLLSGVGPLISPQSSLASLAPLHPPPAPCGSGTCPLGAACSVPPGGSVAPGGVGMVGAPGGSAPTSTGSDIYACAARERGHYVAYEPLGHYTHRDSLSSEAGAGAPAGMGVPGGMGSLSRRGHCPPPCQQPLHSFALGADNGSDHSTPTHSHSRGSVRETSPYKKSASSSPGHIPNRLQLGGNVPHCSEELEPLTPSRSTERLNREMQNLEGLMKDLSAITQHQFHC
ncbi:hypothetical protein K1T71_014314 [Dendrolimus kikuchii]|uniref:Uncharacterized protein n=1 Tax=Dendrolimus kikuchii TaxID=765133 RepID=A0ACC1CFN5_9NEOP|nr:hypothetical protein K1T71_014314 [Dendrolimus kikuchii]